ncbi:hypothetical protein I312_106623 [Cryptococcus bacillisporus CA1280]|uniref:uncharacterized protein n=1 Tax=Cryptococcus bacillisporus CA1280 TaxID=1296109 RepID=UPI00336974EF
MTACKRSRVATRSFYWKYFISPQSRHLQDGKDDFADSVRIVYSQFHLSSTGVSGLYHSAARCTMIFVPFHTPNRNVLGGSTLPKRRHIIRHPPSEFILSISHSPINLEIDCQSASWV